MSTPKIMNEILVILEANWQLVATLFGALGVGYAVARRFEKLLGKDREGRSVVDRLERMEHQMYPNGGTSLADKLDYVRRDQNKMKQSVAEISGELRIIKDIVTVIVDK